MTQPPEASSPAPAAVLPEARGRIARAREIIGPGAPDDYVLRPSEHAARYEGAAPELAELLRSAEVEIAARRYEERDAIAVQAQARFRQVSGRARVAIFAAAIAASRSHGRRSREAGRALHVRPVGARADFGRASGMAQGYRQHQ